MTAENSAPVVTQVLATDLDGTLIPIPGNSENRTDLDAIVSMIESHRPRLIYATGRLRRSAEFAIESMHLPLPDVLICDVGTEICVPDENGTFSPSTSFERHVESLLQGSSIESLNPEIATIDGLRYRGAEKQNRFKIALSTERHRLSDVVDAIEQIIRNRNHPFSVIHSFDIDSGDALIDIVPQGASKALAIRWWAERERLPLQSILYAGDSGNDLAALCAGFRAVVVGNAQRTIARQVFDAHRNAGWDDRLFLATRPATSGLLDGCKWFELFPTAPPVRPSGLGAVPVSCNVTHFRVRAPKRKSVAVEFVDRSQVSDLQYEQDGCFAGFVPASHGDCYRYVLDRSLRLPDPASRFQPNGVHNDSQVTFPQFAWTDDGWEGIRKSDLIIYELHIGAFTEQGSYLSAIDRIPELVELGVTAIELMPVAQSPGKWNWGYDGVNLFSPNRSFGTPDEFRIFIDACHAAGLAVILDVVYNHLGPEGNYLSAFGQYYSKKHGTPWGEAFDFDGPNAPQVRRFIVENALYWLRDFHLDGLRLDAVHFMFDDSEYSILDEIRDHVAQLRSSVNREIHLVAEANLFDRRLAVGGRDQVSEPPYCACWCDDIMHSIYSLGTVDISLTSREYRGAADVAEALTHGFIYTGPTVTRVAEESRDELQLKEDRSYLSSLVVALQTHDSVGNHPHGKRLHELASVDFQKAAAALFMLYPAIPMVFMGEEFASKSPFPFFVDFEDPALRKRVDRGRAAEYPQHQWDGALSPSDPAAFFSAKCHDREIRNPDTWKWYRDLITLRKRFVGDGLLAPQNFTAQSQIEANYFSLHYSRASDGRSLHVHVRLQSADQDQKGYVKIPVSGAIELDTNPREATNSETLNLGPNQAVVFSID